MSFNSLQSNKIYQKKEKKICKNKNKHQFEVTHRLCYCKFCLIYLNLPRVLYPANFLLSEPTWSHRKEEIQHKQNAAKKNRSNNRREQQKKISIVNWTNNVRGACIQLSISNTIGWCMRQHVVLRMCESVCDEWMRISCVVLGILFSLSFIILRSIQIYDRFLSFVYVSIKP